MKNKFLNDAIIGGKKIVASYSKKGELLRVMHDAPDFRQYIEYFHVGLKINDSGIVYLHDDINNAYNQYYSEDTNVLNTEIKNSYFGLDIKQTDFIHLEKSIIFKKYTFINNSTINLDMDFLMHSKLISDSNDMAGSKMINNLMLQYTHNSSMCMFSNLEVKSHQLNDTDNSIASGVIKDKDYIGMSADSSMSFDLGVLLPGDKKEIVFYMYIPSNEAQGEEKLLKQISEIKKIDVNKEQSLTEKYWKKYVKDHINIVLKEEINEYNKKFNKIYKRSILLFPLLTNKETGGVAASVEVDENMEHCGRYAYCWTRDAVFITKAFDKLKMTNETEKFYKNFCKKTQSQNGMWEQRFYTDGRLAPCWGYQIDETASVIFGIYEHYMQTKNVKFLKDTLKMCEKAENFLNIYMDNILYRHDTSDLVKMEIEESYNTAKRNKLNPSYDLWEMNEGIHLYSLASIYAALNALDDIYKILVPEYEQNRLKLEHITKIKKNIEINKKEIKDFIDKNLVDDKFNCFRRNMTDVNIDISMLRMCRTF